MMFVYNKRIGTDALLQPPRCRGLFDPVLIINGVSVQFVFMALFICSPAFRAQTYPDDCTAAVVLAFLNSEFRGHKR